MQIEDGRRIEHGHVLETDLAIVGTGPAGFSIARQFVGSSVRVMLLESGGLEEDPATTVLNEIENVGAPRWPDPRQARNRVLGGSSQTWSGKCTTFDAIDFEPRDWVPYSGWPIGPADLDAYLGPAGRLMHLGPNVYDDGLWPRLGRDAPDPDVDPGLLRSCFWQFSRSPDQALDFLRFGPEFLKLDALNMRLLTHSTVTHIDTDGRRLAGLEVLCDPDRKLRVKANAVVLCAGAIENARLLLASNRTVPNGLGNDTDVVGRFLMDHPRASLGEFTGPAAGAIKARLDTFVLKADAKAHFYQAGFALSPDLQRKERLLNCAIYLVEHRSADDPWDAIRRLYTRRSEHALKDAMAAACNPRLLVEGAFRRMIGGRNVAHKVEKLAVDCSVEQVPDPESRITLSDRTDRLGVPVSRIDWKISELETRSLARLACLFASESARVGLPPPKLARWVEDGRPDPATFMDAAHPTGTTRMSDDPRQGVVDRNCRLHSVGDVYVAGSSVFPTAGHANPTLMIVAMALRLAETLRRIHFS